ncbi:MAG: hypothetical protein KF789_02785 [Bdellovibrionaceae bacterium]|nr:hypothetical protein [Pseudobdellovibrionaceae bacterium]
MKCLRAFAATSLGLLLSMSAWAASYTVPTDNPRLSPYANFEMSDVQVERWNGSLRISYILPIELTGEAVTIVLDGKDSAGELLSLKGEFGKATCVGSSCEVDYKHLPINREAVVARLREVSSSQEEFQARLQLSMDFEGNPIGIVNLDAPLFSPVVRDHK